MRMGKRVVITLQTMRGDIGMIGAVVLSLSISLEDVARDMRNAVIDVLMAAGIVAKTEMEDHTMSTISTKGTMSNMITMRDLVDQIHFLGLVLISHALMEKRPKIGSTKPNNILHVKGYHMSIGLW